MRGSRARGGRNDYLRRSLLSCVVILCWFTFSNIKRLQKSIDRLHPMDRESFTGFGEEELGKMKVSQQMSHKETEGTASNVPNLTCLVHGPMSINASAKRVSDPSKHILHHDDASVCGELRRQWLDNPPLSKYARMIEEHQTNCSLPLATHTFDNTFGLGSHFILWGQAMCSAMETGYRMRSYAPEWLWLDQQHCDMDQAVKSPTLCYFPNTEFRCSPTELPQPRNVSDPRRKEKWCKLAKQSTLVKDQFRAGVTEYIFQKVSPLVIREAKRQTGIVFPGGKAPDGLISLHIRWGDKFWEMDLPPIQEYIDAVKSLLPDVDAPAHIYLSTEDPRAHDELMETKPDHWTVYPDITLRELADFRPKKGNRASWTTRNTKGRAGLVALGSLLVAMEANLFVLTTKSNWSSMMNHIRTNIIDPRCGQCTRAVDLRPGGW